MDWFLYDNGLRHERVKITIKTQYNVQFKKVGKVCYAVRRQ